MRELRLTLGDRTARKFERRARELRMSPAALLRHLLLYYIEILGRRK